MATTFLSKSQIVRWGIVAAICITAIVTVGAFYEDQDAWRESLARFLETARGTPWAFPLVCLLFVISGVVLFPVSILNLVCAMVFGYWGIFYALVGGMLNTAVYFGAGHYVRHHQGGRNCCPTPKSRRWTRNCVRQASRASCSSTPFRCPPSAA